MDSGARNLKENIRIYRDRFYVGQEGLLFGLSGTVQYRVGRADLGRSTAVASTGRGEKVAQAGGWRDPSLLRPGEDKPLEETDREKARNVTRGHHGGEGGDGSAVSWRIGRDHETVLKLAGTRSLMAQQQVSCGVRR